MTCIYCAHLCAAFRKACSWDSVHWGKYQIFRQLSLAQPALQVSEIARHIQLLEFLLASGTHGSHGCGATGILRLVWSYIVHTLCCLLEMCTGEYTFSPFPAHCKAVVKHHAHNAKVAQHTLTVTNPSAQSSHAKSPLPLACFRNSPILLLLLYSAQATVSLSKWHTSSNLKQPRKTRFPFISYF
jgi:hypothetical protein